jgi:hypothetical protein
VAFFNALGIPDNNLMIHTDPTTSPAEFQRQAVEDRVDSLRATVIPTVCPMALRGFFGTGPRQTKPLDGMFSKLRMRPDQGLLQLGVQYAAVIRISTPIPVPPRRLRLRLVITLRFSVSPWGGGRGGGGGGGAGSGGGVSRDAACRGDLDDHGITQGGSELWTCKPCGSLPPFGALNSRSPVI